MRKPYGRLRGLMAEYGLSQSDLAKISGLSEVSINKKLSKGEEFKITPAYKILAYFRAQGENVSFEELFCPQVVTKVTNNLYTSGD